MGTPPHKPAFDRQPQCQNVQEYEIKYLHTYLFFRLVILIKSKWWLLGTRRQTVPPYWITYLTLPSLFALCCAKGRYQTLPLSTLSFATPLTSFHDIQPAEFLSFSIILRQVVFGLPTFLFPSGVQVSAVAQWRCLGILSICPIHFHLRLLISLLTRTEPVLSLSSSTEITYGQKIPKLLFCHWYWNESSFSLSFFFVLYVSLPYRRTGFTRVVNNVILVFLLNCLELQTFFNFLKVFLALLSRFCISLFAPPSLLTVAPRHTNPLTFQCDVFAV